MMVIVDCPWCEGPAEVHGDVLDCPACAVKVGIATDERVLEAAA